MSYNINYEPLKHFYDNTVGIIKTVKMYCYPMRF